MKKTTVRCHLMDILAEVPDPRKEKGKRHPLASDPRSRHRRNPVRCQELRSDRRIRTVS